MSEAVTHLREEFERERPNLPGVGTDWVDAARRDAVDRFERNGFPKPRDEDWKYTRVAPIERRAFRARPGDSGSIDVSDQLLSSVDSGPAHELVFVDGRYHAALSRETDLPDGVKVASLAEVLRRDPDTAKRHLIRCTDAPDHAFTALNTAFVADGALVELDAGVSLDHPLHLLFVSSGTADTMSHPRVVVSCGAGCNLTVVESYVGLADGPYLSNPISEVWVGERGRVAHYKLQREAASAFHVSTLRVRLQARSELVSYSVSLGAALSRHELDVRFAAPGARCTLYGLYVGRGRQHVDYQTRVDHAEPDCISHEDYRGVLADRARGVFNGRVLVQPGAQGTDASQSNRNLLLSRDAEVDTKPQLEIYADDVKCSHGATVGQIDEQMVFYLRARGLSESVARGLLTYGFARDLIDRMELPVMREMAARALLDRMPDGDRIRSMLS